MNESENKLYNFVVGNRWQGTTFTQFRYDDEVYGSKVRSSIENMQSGDTYNTSKTLE